MIRAVLFDLDGVLCSSSDLHFRALNAALEAHNYLPIPPVLHRGIYNGLPTAKKLDHLVKNKWVRGEDVSSIAALKQKETRRLLEAEVRFDPEKFCLLFGLARHHKIAIVTNSIPETAQLVVARLLKESPWHFPLLTNADGESKPSPDLYLKAIARLEVGAAECLAVEDGQYGVQAATAAGCRVLKVAGPEEVTPRRIWEALC